MSDARVLLHLAAARLEAAAVPDEALAEVYTPRGLPLVKRAPALRPIGRAWRLGVVLLSADGRLFTAAESTRAIEPKWFNHRSTEVEHRRLAQQAAHRGPFAEGEVVNFEVVELAVDDASLRDGSGPLSLVDDTVMLRWAGHDLGLTRLDAYLDDRVSLLIGD
ncbi:MAG TPA: hypothetical protein VNJ54_19670 [Plantibacter sp.]|uniref:hypothetical protein n=1 Tax=unclassified Plantibacter TaxID=2624265 RepID=UPI002C6D2C01|nr:hypothetical protein [Plantibacter sp.]